MSTGRLHIAFGYYASDTGEAMAPVEVVNDQLRRVYQGHVSLDVSKPTEVKVPPGRYLVRIKLPSGEIASEQASVPPGGSETVTLAPPTRSARESLGWAYYLKQTPEGAGTENSVFANGPFRLRAERVRPDVLLWAHGNGKWNELVRNP